MNLSAVLIDESNGASTSSGEKLTPALLAFAAQILVIYCNRFIAPFWGGTHLVRAGSSPTDILSGEVPSYTTPTLTDAPGAIAYHTVDGYGIPAMYDGLTLSDTLFGPSGWLVAQTHEFAETIGDPGTNSLRADNRGRLYAQELCDPVEVQSFSITIDADGLYQVQSGKAPGLAADGSFTAFVSNAVTDAFFTPNHAGPYDVMTAMSLHRGTSGPTGPFTLVPSGGGDYQIVETDPQSETQITAAHPHAPLAAMGLGSKPGLGVFGNLNRRVAKKAHPSSRAYRRGLRLKASP